MEIINSINQNTIGTWFHFALNNGIFSEEIYNEAIQKAAEYGQLDKFATSLSEALKSAFVWRKSESDIEPDNKWQKIHNILIEIGL